MRHLQWPIFAALPDVGKIKITNERGQWISCTRSYAAAGSRSTPARGRAQRSAIHCRKELAHGAGDASSMCCRPVELRVDFERVDAFKILHLFSTLRLVTAPESAAPRR